MPAGLTLQQQVQFGQQMADTDIAVTHYNTPEQQAANTLTPVDGQLQTAGGAAADVPAPRYIDDDRGVIYAMGAGGEVVGNLDNAPSRRQATTPDGRPQERRLHHSSMLAGADVAHAGHIGTEAGKVNYLDDNSGHYQPSAEHTFDAFNRLSEQGVLDKDSTSGRVNLVDKRVGRGGNRGAEADLSFSAFSQTGGNEAAIRAKGAALDRIQPGRNDTRQGAKAAAKDKDKADRKAAAEAAARARAAAEAREREEQQMALMRQNSSFALRMDVSDEMGGGAGAAGPDLDRQDSTFGGQWMAASGPVASAGGAGSAGPDLDRQDSTFGGQWMAASGPVASAGGAGSAGPDLDRQDSTFGGQWMAGSSPVAGAGAGVAMGAGVVPGMHEVPPASAAPSAAAASTDHADPISGSAIDSSYVAGAYTQNTLYDPRNED